MPEMHLRQPQFVYSACGPFTKNKERIQKFKETGDTGYIYKNELDKACFQHDMAYGDFKDLTKRTAAVLRDKALKIASDQKYDGYQRGCVKPPTTSNNSLNPRLSYNDTKIKVQFTGSCLKQPKFTFTHKKVVNIYIVYELGASSSHSSDPTIKNCLFGAVTLTKNAEFEKYKYSGYDIGFDRRSSFSFPSGGFGQNVLNFGADMSSSIHIDNKKKDILVLERGPTQGFESTLTAEKMYSINFTVTKNEFCLSLHYNRANSYLFVNGT